MRIGEIAKLSGLSVDTLRYYEKLGLIPKPLRDAAGLRVYDADSLTWIGFLQRLKTTDMPLKTIKLYAGLRAKGKATENDRLQLLLSHQAAVQAHLTDLQNCLTVLNDKILTYRKNLKLEAAQHVKHKPN